MSKITGSDGCVLCPRGCQADRKNGLGFCQMPDQPVIARAALHMWEEPCLSGKNGSGAVFFFRMYAAVCFLPELSYFY